MFFRLAVAAALVTACASFQPHAALPASRREFRTTRIVAEEPRPRRLTLQEEKDQKDAIAAALSKANDKLDDLNTVEKLAPTSWADMGLPMEADRGPPVPAYVTQAPLVVGGFAFGLFVLNAIGIFGEGPDLDALVDEWSKL